MKHLKRSIAGISAALVVCACAVSAYAVPITVTPAPTAGSAAASPSSAAGPGSGLQGTITQLRTVEEQVQAVQTQINLLNKQLEVTVEEYNQATVNLKDSERRLNDMNGQLSLAENDFEEQKVVLGKRVTDLYKDRYPANLIALLLDTKTLGALIQRIGFLTRVSRSDSLFLDDLNEKRALISGLQAELMREKSAKEKAQATVSAKKTAVEVMLNEQKTYLDTLSTEVQNILKTQNATEARRQAQLASLVLDQFRTWNLPPVQRDIVSTAFSYLGVPYLWAGSTPEAFDCSGLVMYVYSQFGIALPHYSGAQFTDPQGFPVPENDLQPGDLVFFGVSRIHHVGMYIGGGYFIHAPRHNDFVKISPLRDYQTDYAGARRFLIQRY